MPWMDAGLAGDFGVDTLKPVALSGHNLILIRTAEGFRCFKDECSHQPVPLSEFGEVSGGRLVCHAHGAVFEVNDGGRPLCFPAVDSLVEFQVRIEGGILRVFV